MDNAAIDDMFSGLGPVSIKRMFGGKGIYHEGLIVAIETDGDIFLKADAQTAPAFLEAGSSQWTYEGNNKSVSMPYWSVPEEAFDDPDEMAKWVRLAFEAALRAPKPVRKKKTA